jgi:hypothetical protein
MKDLILSLAMLTAFALIWGGWRNLRGQSDVKRGWLMLGAALVLLVNLVVLSIPMPLPATVATQ